MIQDAIALTVGTLDSIPDAARALLSALVLAVAVRMIGRSINPSRAGLALSYRKAVIVALVVLPLTICFALDWRFVVVVDELPEIPPTPEVIWWIVWGSWLGGVLWHGIGRVRDARAFTPSASPAGDTIEHRKTIWCERMGIDPRSVAVVLDTDERPRSHGWLRHVICLPLGADRWDPSVIDAVLAHELAHARSRATRWLSASEAIAVLYWPTPWIGNLTRELSESFQINADHQALSHVKDRIAYARALRQIAERMRNADSSSLPRPALAWTDPASIEARAEHISELVTDPRYDRVFWAVLQAVLAVFILTGTTLREAREDEGPSLIQFVDQWYLPFEASGKYEDSEPKTTRR